MNDNVWDLKKFSDCADLIKDTINPEETENVPYIGLEHIIEGGLTLSGYGFSNNVISAKNRFKKGDILFGKLRPYFRKVVLAPFDGVCSTDIWVVRAKPDIDQTFLFYWMASQVFVDDATRASEGTKMPRAKWEFVSRIEKEVPLLPLQLAIARILGSLDDKIELNHQMNETLEAMARAIFQSWFVDFDPVRAKAEGRDTGLPLEIAALFPDGFQQFDEREVPRGWEIGRISDLADIISGKRPEKSVSTATSEHQIPLFGGGGIMGYVTTPLFTQPILLTGRVGTLGEIFRITFPCWASDNTLIILPKVPDSYEYLYYLLRSLDFDSFNRGSTQPLVTQNDLKAQEILIPSQKIVEKYHRIVESIFNKIDENEQQSSTLAQIRDSLLPKLMSGEIRVTTDSQSGVKIV